MIWPVLYFGEHYSIRSDIIEQLCHPQSRIISKLAVDRDKPWNYINWELYWAESFLYLMYKYQDLMILIFQSIFMKTLQTKIRKSCQFEESLGNISLAFRFQIWWPLEFGFLGLTLHGFIVYILQKSCVFIYDPVRYYAGYLEDWENVW